VTHTASDANAGPHSLLRTRGRHDSGRVGMIELFFDLVFVFAVTQLSHSLLAHLGLAGAAHVAILLPAVWWVWMYTSWSTNWLDPERLPVRLCLFGMMAAGLVLAAAIPQAFEGRGDVFAIAYVSMQIGRTCFVLWATRHERRSLYRNFQRVIFWLAIAGVCWIVGGYMEPQTRWYWWLLALGIEMAAPFAFFWTPGLGRSEFADWDIDGGHMAERCALFVIIALGESLLVTGATFAELQWNTDTVIAMLVALVGTLAMWWVYFDTGAERAAHRIAQSNDPGRQGRNAYTYLHLLIVAGIIVCAVADELVLAHPAHATDAGIVTILAGPLFYLLGNLLFKWVTNDRRGPPFSHLIGVGLLLILTPLALNHLFPALVLSGLTTVVLVLVAVWESVVLRRA
jgi:low temperature requirement protein LtrA